MRMFRFALSGRIQWLLAVGCALIAIVYAHQLPRWLGEVISTQQMASTSSAYFYPAMCAAIALQARQLFSGKLNYIERLPEFASRSRLLLLLGWLTPFLVCFSLVKLVLIASTSSYGPLTSIHLGIPLVGLASMCLWGAPALVIGAKLPPIISLPALMVSSFLLPLYAGENPGTIASASTPLSPMGIPPSFTINTWVVLAQILFFAAAAACVSSCFLVWQKHADARRPVAQASGIIAALAAIVLIFTAGLRIQERTLPLAEAACDSAGPATICLLPENHDLLAATTDALSQISADSPAGSLPQTVAEYGIVGADVNFSPPRRVAAITTNIVDSLLHPLAAWGVCDAWFNANSDTYLTRLQWLSHRAGLPTATSAATIAANSSTTNPTNNSAAGEELANILALPLADQWHWWDEPAVQCAGQSEK